MKKGIFLLTAALALALSVSGCSRNDETEGSVPSQASEQISDAEVSSSVDDTQRKVLFTQHGLSFYTPDDALIQITGSYTFHLLDIKNYETTQPIVVSPDPCGLVADQNMLYGTQKGETGIFSWDISDISFTERRTLFNSRDLKTASGDQEALWFDRLEQARDGGDGFIYCILGYDEPEKSPLDGRLMRYSKDGKSLELIGEEKLSTEAVLGDKIYYACADKGRGGLFRMNKDGNGSEQVEGTEKLTNIRELNIIGGDLYFIAESSDKNGGRLYSFRPDDKESVLMSDELCLIYYVDKENKVLYYLGGENEAPTLFRRSLSDGTEKPLLETKLLKASIDPETEKMTANGDYLYFSSSGFELPVFIDEEEEKKDEAGLIKYKTVSGMRYDLAAGAMDYLYCYYLGSKDEATGEMLTAGPVMIEYRSSKGTVTDSKSGLFIF